MISKSDGYKFHEKIKRMEKYMDNEICTSKYIDIFKKCIQRKRTNIINLDYFKIFGCGEVEYERYCKIKTKN